MFGLVIALGFAWLTGLILSYLFGLGHLDTYWHLGFGLAGMALGWFFVLVLRVPYWVRVSVDGVDVVPIWAAIGTAAVVMVAVLVEPGGGEGG
jgi:hypothetical protein